MSFARFSRLGIFPLSKLLIANIIQMLRGKLARDFFITTGTNLSIAVLSALGGILTARLLGPAGRGELATAIVWAGILGTLFQIGLAQALTYFAAKQELEISHILSTTIVLALLQGVVAAFLGWIATSYLLDLSQPNSLYTVHIYLLSIPFTTLTTYLSTIAQGLGWFTLFNFLRVYQTLGFIIAVILALVLGYHSASFIVTSMLCFQVSSCVIGLVLFWFKVQPSWKFDYKIAQSLLYYGVKSYWGNLAWIANARLDQLLMSIFLSTRELGLYAVGVSYAMILFQISGAFAMITFPRVVGKKRKSAQTIIFRMLMGNLVITVPLSILAAVLSPQLLPLLFGYQFQEVVPITIVLLIGTIILGCNYILSDGLRGLGYPLIPSMGELLGVSITIGGLILVLQSSGILGAAWVSVTSYLATFLVLITALFSFSGRSKSLNVTQSKPTDA